MVDPLTFADLLDLGQPLFELADDQIQLGQPIDVLSHLLDPVADLERHLVALASLFDLPVQHRFLAVSPVLIDQGRQLVQLLRVLAASAESEQQHGDNQQDGAHDHPAELLRTEPSADGRWCGHGYTRTGRVGFGGLFRIVVCGKQVSADRAIFPSGGASGLTLGTEGRAAATCQRILGDVAGAGRAGPRVVVLFEHELEVHADQLSLTALALQRFGSVGGAAVSADDWLSHHFGFSPLSQPLHHRQHDPMLRV